ncbi:iron chelate uptake ABC transporter family permease subunit [Terrihabitans sp. B22-R8]|uniref:iron chelate uptake ABC transporter family permease subunit n=1 Tax=Terrihabitans sp. B22-R8 TaxID=3425128 RepID=UPI00403D177A
MPEPAAAFPSHTRIRPERHVLLGGLGLAALLCVSAFMLYGLRGNLAFVLELRAVRLAALVQVAIAIAVSTVIFQTVTANRLLTPSIMGVDALYILVQTSLIFTLGGFGFSALDARLKFAGESLLLVALAVTIFVPMLRARIDMTMMLLAGVTLGVLFRSLSQFLSRMIDPNDFAVLQGSSFANFADVDAALLGVGTIVTIIACAAAWQQRHVLDIVALGADPAIGLGVEWRRTIGWMLVLVASLVAVSTALVGPVAFFGLLVAALAERIAGTRRHAVLLPAAALVAIVVLVGGQALFQHLLGGATTLGVVIEFVGGLVFLAMLISAVRR